MARAKGTPSVNKVCVGVIFKTIFKKKWKIKKHPNLATLLDPWLQRVHGGEKKWGVRRKKRRAEEGNAGGFSLHTHGRSGRSLRCQVAILSCFSNMLEIIFSYFTKIGWQVEIENGWSYSNHWCWTCDTFLACSACLPKPTGHSNKLCLLRCAANHPLPHLNNVTTCFARRKEWRISSLVCHQSHGTPGVIKCMKLNIFIWKAVILAGQNPRKIMFLKNKKVWCRNLHWQSMALQQVPQSDDTGLCSSFALTERFFKVFKLFSIRSSIHASLLSSFNTLICMIQTLTSASFAKARSNM